MSYGFFSSCWTRIAPMVVFETSVEMWNGRDQSKPLKIGAADNHFFNSAKAA